MLKMNTLSHQMCWIYWDPPREAFTIPFIDHPVVWYGILFVSGFIFAYFLINPILARFLVQTRQLSQLDILSWPKLIQELRSSSSPFVPQIIAQLDSSSRHQLKQVSQPQLTLPLQQGILKALNGLLQNGLVTRQELCQIFHDSLATPKQTAYLLTDRLCWFIVTGTVIGARLGAVFFYDWPYFRENPMEIFKVWHGGLASHGGTIGVLLSLYFSMKYLQKWIPQLTFLRLCDSVAIPTALVACFIRLGNFMNQEIVGTPTDLPWGILFGHPADNVSAIPRHPIQLYEAGAYFLTFVILWQFWKNQIFNNRPGAFVGLFFIFIFGSRFILEFWKAPLASVMDNSFLQMGQILSIPFILLGAFLFWKSKQSFSTFLQKRQPFSK